MATNGMDIVSLGKAPIKVDIVFVHGLRGDKISTWTAANNIFWPSHLLPTDLPNARIMTWGYDSAVAHLKDFSSQNSIFGHADNLLMDVSAERKAKDEVIKYRRRLCPSTDRILETTTHYICWAQPGRPGHQTGISES